MVKKHVSIGQRRYLEQSDGVVYLENRLFALSTQIKLGESCNFLIEGHTDLPIKPHTLLINAVIPNMLFIYDFRTDEQHLTIGSGDIDAHAFWNNGAGNKFDMHSIDPASRVRVFGRYAGFVPDKMIVGTRYIVSVTFIGPSNIKNLFNKGK